MAIELKGGRLFGIQPTNGHNGRVSVPLAGDRWQTITWCGGAAIACTVDGRPRIAQTNGDVGHGGLGILLSPDAARVTFLSKRGCPAGSGNLAGWAPTDIKASPTVYPTAGRTSSGELAFHPFLPLAAFPGSTAAVFFDSQAVERAVFEQLLRWRLVPKVTHSP